MSELTGPGREQRDLRDQVADAARRHPGHQFPLAGRFDLEDADGPGGADHRERGLVVAGDGVEVDPLAGGPLDLGDRVRHRRLHADAEHVELDHPGGLRVVLVELAERQAVGVPLDRGPVEQARVGQQDAAGVQGDVPGEPVQAFGQAEGHGELGDGEPAAAQLGQFGQRAADMRGPDVRERRGDPRDLVGRQAQRGADVPDRAARAVGRDHAYAGAALLAVRVQDHPVRLDPAGRLDVQVDVGHGGAAWRQEPLHDQPVLQRVDGGDPGQVVDQAAGPGPADRAADAALPDAPGHVGHGEEVGGQVGTGDDGQLVLEPFPGGVAAPPVPGQGLLAGVPQPGLGVAGG